MEKWSQLIQSTVDGKYVINFIRYDTVEDLLVEHWQCPLDDLRKSECGGETIDGKEISFTFDEVINNLKTMGCHGFAKNNEIHFWIDPNKASAEDVFALIAHEKGHLTEPFEDDDIKEEKKAERFGDAAVLALSIYKKIFEIKG